MRRIITVICLMYSITLSQVTDQGARSGSPTSQPTSKPLGQIAETIPLPAVTPFDNDPDRRMMYLELYERGYQLGLRGRRQTYCPNGSDTYDAERKGHSDGWAVGHEARYQKQLDAVNRKIPFTEPKIPPTTIDYSKKKLEPQLRQLMDRRLPDLNFNQIPFREVIVFLSEVTGAEIAVDPAVSELTKDAAIVFASKDIKFSVALDTVLKSVSSNAVALAWDIRDGKIVIFARSPS